MQIVLRTPRLPLRRFTTEDAELIMGLDSDPEVMAFINGGWPTTRAEVVQEILPAWLGYYSRYDGYGFWTIIERGSGQFVGWFHLRPRPGADPAEPELGYRLIRSVWGRGYATEGSIALLHRAFTVLGARRVTAESLAVNTAPRRVMEKCGLHSVRTLHQEWPDKIDGEELGEVEYAVDRDAWLAWNEARNAR